MTEEKKKSSMYVVRTTAGQEKNVAKLVERRVRTSGLPIVSILAPETLRGYIFVEASGPHLVEEAITGIKHTKSRVPGKVSFSEVERYLMTKPVIEELDVGDSVEIIAGPFKGMKAQLTRIDRARQEVTLELLEATFTLPITVHADYVKLTGKAQGQSEASGEET